MYWAPATPNTWLLSPGMGWICVGGGGVCFTGDVE